MIFTEKFEKELTKFINWAIENYTVLDDNNNVINWKSIIVSEYKEPPRNKLEMYIKEIMKNYVIKSKQTDNKIENYKTIIINFKNEKKIKKGLKNKKIDNKNNKIPILDKSIDTSDFHWHCQLDVTTTQLLNAFGKPEYTYNTLSKHIWEWKIIIKDKKYSIYDWRSEFLDDEKKHNFEIIDKNKIIWHLCGEKEKKSVVDIKNLLKYIENAKNKYFDNEENDDIMKKNINENTVEDDAEDDIEDIEDNIENEDNVEDVIEIQEDIKKDQNNMNEIIDFTDDTESLDMEKLNDEDEEYETDDIYLSDNENDEDIITKIDKKNIQFDLENITLEDIIF